MGTRTASRTFLTGGTTTLLPPRGTVAERPLPAPAITEGALPDAPMPADRFVEELLPLLPALLERATPEQRERIADAYRGIFHPAGGEFGEEVFAELIHRNTGLGHAYDRRREFEVLQDQERAVLERQRSARQHLRATGDSTEDDALANELRTIRGRQGEITQELKFDAAVAPNFRVMRELRGRFTECGTDLETAVLGFIDGMGSRDSVVEASALWLGNRDELVEAVKRKTPRSRVLGTDTKPAKG